VARASSLVCSPLFANKKSDAVAVARFFRLSDNRSAHLEPLSASLPGHAPERREIVLMSWSLVLRQ
jgi:hypothetical protein